MDFTHSLTCHATLAMTMNGYGVYQRAALFVLGHGAGRNSGMSGNLTGGHGRLEGNRHQRIFVKTCAETKSNVQLHASFSFRTPLTTGADQSPPVSPRKKETRRTIPRPAKKNAQIKLSRPAQRRSVGNRSSSRAIVGVVYILRHAGSIK